MWLWHNYWQCDILLLLAYIEFTPFGDSIATKDLYLFLLQAEVEVGAPSSRVLEAELHKFS